MLGPKRGEQESCSWVYEQRFVDSTVLYSSCHSKIRPAVEGRKQESGPLDSHVHTTFVALRLSKSCLDGPYNVMNEEAYRSML